MRAAAPTDTASVGDTSNQSTHSVPNAIAEEDRGEHGAAAEAAAEADRVAEPLGDEQQQDDPDRPLGDQVGDRRLAREQDVVGVAAKQVGDLRPTRRPPGRPRAATGASRARSGPSRAFSGRGRTDRDDRDPVEATPTPIPDEQVEHVGTGVRRQARHGDRLGVEAAPVTEPDEQDVTKRGGDEARDQRRQQLRARPPGRPRSSAGPPTIGPPNSAETAENDPAKREHPGLLLARAAEDRERRRRRPSRARSAAPRAPTRRRTPTSQAPPARSPARIAHRHRAAADPLQWRVAAVAGQPGPCRDHDRSADHRQPQDRVPRRARIPQPVLEPVDDREEDARQQRCRVRSSARPARSVAAPGWGRSA